MEIYKGPMLVRYIRHGDYKKNGRYIPYDDISLTLLRTGEKIRGRIFMSKFLAASGNLMVGAVGISETKKWGRQIKWIDDEEFVSKDVIVQGLPAKVFSKQDVEFPFRARLKPELDDTGNFMMDTPYGPVTTKGAVYTRARDKSRDYYE